MYINKTSLQYPLTEGQIKQENPNVSFPVPFDPGSKYELVRASPKPAFNRITERVIEVAPVKVGGLWTQQWSVVGLSQAEADANLAAARAARWEDIKALRDRKTQQGGFPAAGKWFHSDTFSRSQHLGMVISGAGLPAIPWKTMDGSFVTTTPELAQQIFAAAFAQDGAMFAHAEQLKAQVEAAADPATVDINAGWPETFNGV